MARKVDKPEQVSDDIGRLALLLSAQQAQPGNKVLARDPRAMVVPTQEPLEGTTLAGPRELRPVATERPSFHQPIGAILRDLIAAIRSSAELPEVPLPQPGGNPYAAEVESLRREDIDVPQRPGLRSIQRKVTPKPKPKPNAAKPKKKTTTKRKRQTRKRK